MNLCALWLVLIGVVDIRIELRNERLSGQGREVGRDWFATLTERDFDRAYRIAGFILGDAHEAEDATQDALSRAWERRHSLRELDRAQAWFDQILVNACRDRLRKRRPVRLIQLSESDGASGRDPFNAILTTDEALRGLAGLDFNHRAVLVLRFWADLPESAIGERLGIPTGTVKSRLHVALRQIRSAMNAGGPT